ncbi:MAG: CHASE2 domain-containing protein [Cyanobacteria bacterium J06592_8]
MGKIVILKFDGDLEQAGFRVNSTVQEEIHLSDNYAFRTLTEVNGALSANPELALLIQDHWQYKYRSIGAPSARKLASKKITVRGNLYQRKQDCRESAKRLCDRLINWLNSPEFRPIDQQLREAITPYEMIRFLIRTEDNKLYKLPWEEWDLIKRHSKTEVVFGSRKRHTPGKLTDSVLRENVKILAILGHSEGIDIEKDKQQLENLRSIANVVFLVEPKRQQISDKLWEQPWDIIFFAGHSETREDTGRIYLNSQGEYLEVDEIWYGLRQAVDRGLKLAIFNSCDGLGLAQSLDDLQIPLMIVMREVVPDQVAQQFFMNFIEVFRQGKPFHLAEREAREKLQDLEDDYPCATWLPVIYQNLETPPLHWDTSIAQRPKCNLVSAALAIFIAVSLVLLVRPFGVLKSSEISAYDALMRMRLPLEQKDDRLFLITIHAQDVQAQSLEERVRYSLSDTQLEKLLQKLVKLNPAVIGLSNYRPFPIDDKKHPFLAEQFRNNSKLVTSCAVNQAEQNISGFSASPEILNLPPKERTRRLGFSNSVFDGDNRIRRDLLMMANSDQKCLSQQSFSLTVALRYLQTIDPKIDLSTPTPGKRQLGYVLFPSLTGEGVVGYPPNDQDYRGLQVLLNYRALKKVEDIADRLTLSEFLSMNEETIREKIENRIVLIGTIDQGFASLVRTPYSKGFQEDTAGLYVEAHAISQIISAVIDGRPLLQGWPREVEYLWIVLWSGVGGVLAWQFRRGFVLVFAGGIIVIILGCICYVFFLFGYWIPLVPPAIAYILAISGAIALSPVIKQR